MSVFLSPPKVKTPFHEQVRNSFSTEKAKRPAEILPRRLPHRLPEQLLPQHKRPRMPRLPAALLLLLRSKSLVVDLHPLSPPKPAKLRRSTSLLSSFESSSDRFIPSFRNLTPGKMAPVAQEPLPDALPETHIQAQTSRIYQHHVAEACGIDVNARILSYRPLPPERSKPIGLFSSTAKLRPLLALARAKKIPTAPERVLDAPGMADDFYLNLLAWLRTNFVAIGLGDAVYVWNASTGLVGLLCALQSNVALLRWSDDGSYILVGRSDGNVEIWDIETNSKLRTLAYGGSRIAAHTWLLHLVLCGLVEGTIYQSDVRVPSHLTATLKGGHTAEVCGLEYRADGQQFCSGGNDNVVAVWDARSSETLFKKTAHTAAIKALAWCPFQLLLLATGGGNADKRINFWNTATGNRVNTIDTLAQISSLNWGYAKGTGYEVVATAGNPTNLIALYNYPTLQKTGEISLAHDARIINGCLSPDGATLATVAADENLKFWLLFDVHRVKEHDCNMNKLMSIR